MGIQRLGLSLLQKGLMAEKAGIKIKKTSDISKKVFDVSEKAICAIKPIGRKKLQQIQYANMQLTTNLMVRAGEFTKGEPVESLAVDFANKKLKLIEEFKGICPPEYIKKIEKADNPDKLTQLLFNQEFSFYKKELAAGREVPKGKILLEYEQIDREARKQRHAFILAREKALSVPSTNPQVVEIENILREKYGVQFVNLKDDADMAQRVLKAFEKAAKDGDKLPKNVIISDFMVSEGENLFEADTIILASEYAKKRSVGISMKALSTLSGEELETIQLIQKLPNANLYSTSAPEHVPLHEIKHKKQLVLTAYAYKKIPPEMVETKVNTSLYSAISPAHETYTELETKKSIMGLDEAETKLDKYLDFWG